MNYKIKDGILTFTKDRNTDITLYVKADEGMVEITELITVSINGSGDKKRAIAGCFVPVTPLNKKLVNDLLNNEKFYITIESSTGETAHIEKGIIMNTLLGDDLTGKAITFIATDFNMEYDEDNKKFTDIEEWAEESQNKVAEEILVAIGPVIEFNKVNDNGMMYICDTEEIKDHPWIQPVWESKDLGLRVCVLDPEKIKVMKESVAELKLDDFYKRCPEIRNHQFDEIMKIYGIDDSEEDDFESKIEKEEEMFNNSIMIVKNKALVGMVHPTSKCVTDGYDKDYYEIYLFDTKSNKGLWRSGSSRFVMEKCLEQGCVLCGSGRFWDQFNEDAIKHRIDLEKPLIDYNKLLEDSGII